MMLVAHARRASSARPTSGAGFSLLEVLVAFVILALVATALFRLISNSLRNASAADEYSRAALVAESVLAQVAGAKPLREVTASGSVDEGRYAWTASVVPWLPPGVDPELERASEALPTRLYRITVDVAFPAPTGGERKFALATTRLGPREIK
jgi:general secretion pathway protein I